MTGPRIGSLFSGYGGLDAGVVMALGGEIVFHAEIEPGPCRLLERRFPGVPNLGDVTRIDWDAAPSVDVLCLGFPCQDVSTSGLRRGMLPGTRSGLWSEGVRAIAALRPSLVIIENVRGLLSARAGDPREAAPSDMEPDPFDLGDDDSRPVLRALGAVLGDLADLGFDARWVGLPASGVGAPHGRFRVFVVAAPQDADDATRRERGISASGETASGRARANARGRGRASTPDPSSSRLEGAKPTGGAHEGRAHEDTRRRRTRGPHRATTPDTDGDGLESVGGLKPAEPDAHRRDGSGRFAREAVEWGEYEPAIRRWERILGRPAPAPTRPDGRNGAARLNPEFVEWMMGIPTGWVTDPTLGLTRNEQLRMLGNGVVPQQAYAAIAYLLRGTGHQLAA